MSDEDLGPMPEPRIEIGETSPGGVDAITCELALPQVPEPPHPPDPPDLPDPGPPPESVGEAAED